MKLWTIFEIFVALVVFWIFLRSVRGYVPDELMFVVKILEAVYVFFSSLMILFIDSIIAVLKVMRDVLPRAT